MTKKSWNNQRQYPPALSKANQIPDHMESISDFMELIRTDYSHNIIILYLGVIQIVNTPRYK